MEKLILRLSVPSISEQYDIMVTPNILVKKLVALLREALQDASDHRYSPSNNEVLCFERNNQILRGEEYLNKYNIFNGDCLYFI